MNAGDSAKAASRRAAIMAAVSSYLTEESVQIPAELQESTAPHLISAILPTPYESASLNGWKMAYWMPIRSNLTDKRTMRSGWQQV